MMVRLAHLVSALAASSTVSAVAVDFANPKIAALGRRQDMSAATPVSNPTYLLKLNEALY